MLRNFLYLDESIVNEFIAQLEGGVYEVDQVTVRSQGGHSARGRVGLAPIGAEIAGGRSKEQETERKVIQTGPSAFNRLFGLLDESGQIQPINALDRAIWSQLRRGEVLDIEASVSLAGFTKLFDLATQMQQLAKVAAVFERPFEQTATASVGQITDFATLMHSDWIPVVAKPIGSPKYRFLARLDRRKLLVDPMEIEGEAMLFGKLQRILGKGEELPVADVFPAWSALPIAKRRELEGKLRAADFARFGLGETTIRPPGALLTAVAIYR
jgi:hypothetical protein